MSATFFPSINNRMDRSVPKFGARCTINRPVGCPLLDVVGPPWDGVAVATVARARAFASIAETRTAQTAAALKKSLGKTFIAPNLSRCRLFPLSTLTISLPRSITVSQTALPPARAAPPPRVLTLIRLSPVRTLLSQRGHERVSPPNPGRRQRAIGHMFPALHLYRAALRTQRRRKR